MKYLFIISFILMLINTSCDKKYSNKQGERNVVVVEEDCPICYGSGNIDTYCSECDGDGVISSFCNECGGDGRKTQFVSGTRPLNCPDCVGTGIARCSVCDGTGRCNSCDGHGYQQCSVCHGYGLIIFDINDENTWIRCNNCSGSGYANCFLCDGTGECISCERGIADCPKCWGTGRYGSENYSNVQEVECVECNGIGWYREYCYKCSGAGKCREICDRCEGTGIVVVEKEE